MPAYEQSIKLQPHWLTYSSLGTVYFYFEALWRCVCTRSSRRRRSTRMTRITMGNLADGLRGQGSGYGRVATYGTALTLAFKELQVNPKDTTTLAMVGQYYAKSGNDARARDFIQRARAIDPKNASLLYYEAIVHALGTAMRRALASLEKSLAGGYSAREAAEDPELHELAKSRKRSVA
jgi:Flp pilus assembly protein TadD